ncbi:MAG: selenium-dependent molybdenum cofactor biosynthesis protein YqeB [Thermodesulfobacteriota bacterium]
MPLFIRIVIRGAGDLATGVALRLYRSGLRSIVMLEREDPLAVRRKVSFSEAARLGRHAVEGVEAWRAASSQEARAILSGGGIPVMVDPLASSVAKLRPHVLVDAVMAKRNLGTSKGDAQLVIGLGPGFTAGQDCHRVVETHRGHGLGRVISGGRALPNTGVPNPVMGFAAERVLRAPAEGFFETSLDIGDRVAQGQTVGFVDGTPVVTPIPGVLRGLLPHMTRVLAGLKVGDVDPRDDPSCCSLVSDKALAVGGGVLEAILERFNARPDSGRSEEAPEWP